MIKEIKINARVRLSLKIRAEKQGIIKKKTPEIRFWGIVRA